MTDRMPALHPWPLATLLERVDREWTARREIYGLQARRFYKANPDVDLSCTLGGHEVATPVGPAAGPHTQLAENIVLSWLGGARTFELKTVQVLDELDIERPCIDMQNVGFNIEWSQELTLTESLAEYTKAWLMLAVLRQWEPLREVLGESGDYAFEMSVGYDLAGIQSPTMDAFIRGMLDVGPALEKLRAEIPAAFADQREVPVATRLFQHVTLSTFHGCPPDEIEGIVEHLMETYGLDVTVKLNPTLLGTETVSEILHDRLGHHEVELDPAAFAADLKFDRALAMVARLQKFAAARGRIFGLKLTNTLVVKNTRGVMPGESMYLSGKPLHVMAMMLLERLHRALPGQLRVAGQDGPIPVAFSAGIDKDNVAEAVALGLAPVTICSDLLKPGGYGRMAQGLRKLAREMSDQGVGDLAGWQAQAAAAAKAAGHVDAVAHRVAELAEPAGYERYALPKTGKALREVDHQLEMFDCVACTNCVTVCPNNAFLSVPSGDMEGLEAKAQYLVLAELCNDCGNCTTFCPEVGAPHIIKPRLFLDAGNWKMRGAEDFLIEADGSVRGGEGAEQIASILAQAPWSLTD
ncbi:MAG: 4Fe-4S dicluster domain-containing protein [Candidatus Krumholzibacteria bacterium]|nr:4Fe-4S dicluster domain-containing protein [Candidatus Krumholzibacteria bacterium]